MKEETEIDALYFQGKIGRRTFKYLKEAGVTTMKELCEIPILRLKNIRGFGDTSIFELYNLLRQELKERLK